MKSRRFTETECRVLEEIMLHRRDVRGNRFSSREIPDDLLDRILDAATSAPSVGYSQPWEFVIVKDRALKDLIKASFDEENAAARKLFDAERGARYARLKLEGIVESPVNIGVLYKPSRVPVLGQTVVEEVGRYSVVCAIQNMWLMARALNIGVGWVSILDPEKVKQILGAPDDHRLVAYLCVGFVEEFADRPELETIGWETRRARSAVVHYERYGE